MAANFKAGRASIYHDLGTCRLIRIQVACLLDSSTISSCSLGKNLSFKMQEEPLQANQPLETLSAPQQHTNHTITREQRFVSIKSTKVLMPLW